MSEAWSGMAFLAGVQGPLEQYPPIRVMFLVHRLQARGRLVVRWQAGRVEIDIDNGRVVGCLGAPGLLRRAGVEGSPAADLAELLGLAIRAGTPPDRVMEVAAEGLGDLLAATAGLSGGTVEFTPDAPRRGAPMVLPTPIPRMIADGLRRARPAEAIRLQLAPLASRRVVPWLPADAPEARWGLPPVALRLLRRAEERPTLLLLLRSAEGAGREEEWHAADLLLQLGMLSFQDAASAGGSAPPIALPVPRPAPEAPAGRGEDLGAARARLQGLPPWEVLEIEASRQVNDADLDRALRRISARYHPDRLVAASAEVQELAAQCFTVVMEAHERLRDPGLRAELRARLEARERGERYVTDRERQEAELAYARGQLAFRRRQWAEARAAFGEALAQDPAPWRYTYMQLRALYHTGERSGAAVAEALVALEGPRGNARADVLFEAAEILMREQREARGYELCEKIVEVYPEHIGARRWLRLRDMRAAQEPAPPPPASSGGGGLLGSLFGRRKS